MDRPSVRPSRAWFAEWLSDTLSATEISAAIGRHSSLASKFRSGAEFPKAEHLEALVARFPYSEFVLGGISFLPEFEELRLAIEKHLASVVQPEWSGQSSNAADSRLRQQIDSRLAQTGDGIDVVRTAGRLLLIVAPGHGATMLCRRLRVRSLSERHVIDLSRSEVLRIDDQVRSFIASRSNVTVVAPADRVAALSELSLPAREVPSPTWSDLLECEFGVRLGTSPVCEGGVLFHRVPLGLVKMALAEYIVRRCSPAHLPSEGRIAALSSFAPSHVLRPLSPAQSAFLKPVTEACEHTGWAVVVQDQDDIESVAAEFTERLPLVRPLQGVSLAGLLRAWADLLEIPDLWPSSLDSSRRPCRDTAFFIEVRDDAPRAAVEAMASIFAASRQIDGVQKGILCGAEESIMQVASYLHEDLVVTTLPPRPDGHGDNGIVNAHSPLPLLPALDLDARHGDEWHSQWVDDYWRLEERLSLLNVNTFIEVPIGQGGSHAALSVRVMRKERDAGDPAIVSLEDLVDYDIADEALEAAGFRVPQDGYDWSTIGSPYLWARLSFTDGGRLEAAESVASRVFCDELQLLDGLEEEILYLDLSSTRFGRVPAESGASLPAETLVPSYIRLAKSVLEQVSRRTALTFVFAPPGIYSQDVLTIADWSVPLRLPQLTGSTVAKIRRSHGLSLWPILPTTLESSLASAEIRILASTDLPPDGPAVSEPTRSRR